ncbi:PucR family transcriptional regulator [Nocardioides daejeonensis]|uniref:PucR family transcriptional regulator n=1 Tax=Nocardioides daejeonensis TaxID=1046556 RepID=UPI000D7427FD|nr:PucR family transcriptional regulator [Nocardioides daejeonensis]
MASRRDDAPTVKVWLQGFVEAALHPDEVDQFVRSVDDEILGAIPEIAGDPTLVEELHASTRAHWRNFLVVGLSEEYRLALPPAAVALSLSIARRHLDIGVLLKVYRVANKSTFRYLTEHTQPEMLPPGLPRDEALLTLWQRAELWIDDSVESLIIHFTEERSALTEGTQARRGELIGSLIAGARPSALAERILGHRFGLWQTAFVLSATSPSQQEIEAPFYDLAVRVCTLLGLPQPLTTLAASREIWGWVATPEPPVLALEPAAELMTSLELHLAFGRPCQGAEAFRLSHLQAIAAQRVGVHAPAACHAYGEVELVSLVGDSELTREMIRRELGPLLGPVRGYDVLRRTALVYLQAGQSFDLAAERLFVHPNTVRYRIGRIEEQLGCRIAQRAAVLETALSWLDVYGSDALGRP